MMTEDEVLALTKLFNGNRHTTVPSEVRRRLGILNKGKFKLLWIYDKPNDRIYIKVSKSLPGSFDTTPYP